MSGSRLSPAELARRLEACRADYGAAKARISEIGFTCEGSLVERYTTCNNPNCCCADPTRRHGPYWQLSWKQNGRTVSRLLSPDQAALYGEWIANRRRLESLLAEMRDLSRRAGEYIATQSGFSFQGPSRPRPGRPSAG
jgi:hypothetical protein